MTEIMQFGFVVEYVKDIDSATRFFVDVLGLQVQRTHPQFVQFEHFALASDESLTGRDEPEVYWLVDDASAAVHDLSAKGEVSVPLRELPFGKVFGVKDPRGRTQLVLELARNRPSQAVG